MQINYTLSLLKCVANEQIVQKCFLKFKRENLTWKGNYVPYSGELS